jgi:hypothetical protein
MVVGQNLDLSVVLRLARHPGSGIRSCSLLPLLLTLTTLTTLTTLACLCLEWLLVYRVLRLFHMALIMGLLQTGRPLRWVKSWPLLRTTIILLLHILVILPGAASRGGRNITISSSIGGRWPRGGRPGSGRSKRGRSRRGRLGSSRGVSFYSVTSAIAILCP